MRKWNVLDWPPVELKRPHLAKIPAGHHHFHLRLAVEMIRMNRSCCCHFHRRKWNDCCSLLAADCVRRKNEKA